MERPEHSKHDGKHKATWATHCYAQRTAWAAEQPTAAMKAKGCCFCVRAHPSVRTYAGLVHVWKPLGVSSCRDAELGEERGAPACYAGPSEVNARRTPPSDMTLCLRRRQSPFLERLYYHLSPLRGKPAAGAAVTGVRKDPHFCWPRRGEEYNQLCRQSRGPGQWGLSVTGQLWNTSRGRAHACPRPQEASA